jgi:pentatricopeptide repeat protein
MAPPHPAPRARASRRADAGLIVPDEVLFSVLIRAHGAAAAPPWGDISSLLGRMKHTWGISPSTVTYNALLEICAATNDYERGCQLIDRMLEEGVQPDGFTVAAVSARKSLRSYLKRGM